MSSLKTKLRDIELYPYVKDKWLDVFEYFIGGGTPQTIPCEGESNPIEVFKSRGGVRYNAYKTNLAQQTYRSLLASKPESPYASTEKGQDNCPPHKGEQGTESPDGEKPG
jgi:hypothetical protein